MSRAKVFAIASCLAIIALALPAQADEWNKKTMITVREPIALPNTVLQPGTYTMQVSDSQANRHIVQIFDEDGKLVTQVAAMAAHRLLAADNLQFTFWETPPGRPPALRAWFWPGDTYGSEFQYTPSEAVQLAQVQVPPAPAPAPAAPPPAAAPAPAPAPPAAAPPPPAPAPAPVIAPVLPKTASPLPLMALAGLLSAAAALGTKLIRKRS